LLSIGGDGGKQREKDDEERRLRSLFVSKTLLHPPQYYPFEIEGNAAGSGHQAHPRPTASEKGYKRLPRDYPDGTALQVKRMQSW
jgi:hypothetical protein